MKIFLIFFVCLLISSCSQKDSICGCENPQEELTWLKELIQKADTDKTGNYWGCIWHGKFRGKDIFITEMMLGSGGVAFWAFDCKGNHFVSHGCDECIACEFVGNHHTYQNEKVLDDLTIYSASNIYKNDFIHCAPASIYRLTD